MLTDVEALRTNLHAPAPDDDLADKLQTFGQFIGSWHLRWVSAATDLDTVEGELHFGWVLGGRAIQDVWIVPGTGTTVTTGRVRAFHGSTIRFYDPVIDGWRSTWVEPINSRVRKFIGRNDCGSIELISRDEDPLLRWRFTEITGLSFTWTGEVSVDNGHTWQLEETMYATRTL